MKDIVSLPGLILLTFLNIQAQELTYRSDQQGILILEGDQRVLYYQQETKSKDGKYPRANYIHPLFDLQGNPITEDFPEDHYHHRGIFWAWHQVLVDGIPMGDSWECSDFSWNVTQATATKEAENLYLYTKTLWSSSELISEAKQVPFVEESTQITVYPRAENYRIIDFEIALKALVQNVKIGGSEDIKGYGGFSGRIKLPPEVVFNSSDKVITAKNEAITAKRWMQFEGTYQTGDHLGLIIIGSASNPTPNNSWILRTENSMQNAVFPGREPYPIAMDHPTVLKYRLVIYSEKPNESELIQWKEF